MLSRFGAFLAALVIVIVAGPSVPVSAAQAASPGHDVATSAKRGYGYQWTFAIRGRDIGGREGARRLELPRSTKVTVVRTDGRGRASTVRLAAIVRGWSQLGLDSSAARATLRLGSRIAVVGAPTLHRGKVTFGTSRWRQSRATPASTTTGTVTLTSTTTYPMCSQTSTSWTGICYYDKLQRKVSKAMKMYVCGAFKDAASEAAAGPDREFTVTSMDEDTPYVDVFYAYASDDDTCPGLWDYLYTVDSYSGIWMGLSGALKNTYYYVRLV